MRLTGFNQTTPINQNCKSKYQNAPAFKGEILVVEEGTIEFVPIMVRLMLSLKSNIEKAWTLLSIDCKQLTFDNSLDKEAKLMTDLLNAKHAKENFKLVFFEDTAVEKKSNLVKNAAELN